MLLWITFILLVFELSSSHSEFPKSFYLIEQKICPTTKSLWKKQERMYNCSGLTYHCVQNKERKYWEVCVQARNITKSGCPIIGNIGGQPEFLQGPYGECNSSNPKCPQEPYFYPSNELYRYPACISNLTIQTTLQNTTGENSMRDMNSTVIGLGISLGISVLVIIFFIIFSCLNRRRKNRKKWRQGTADEEQPLSSENDNNEPKETNLSYYVVKLIFYLTKLCLSCSDSAMDEDLSQCLDTIKDKLNTLCANMDKMIAKLKSFSLIGEWVISCGDCPKGDKIMASKLLQMKNLAEDGMTYSENSITAIKDIEAEIIRLTDSIRSSVADQDEISNVSDISDQCLENLNKAKQFCEAIHQSYTNIHNELESSVVNDMICNYNAAEPARFDVGKHYWKLIKNDKRIADNIVEKSSKYTEFYTNTIRGLLLDLHLYSHEDRNSKLETLLEKCQETEILYKNEKVF